MKADQNKKGKILIVYYHNLGYPLRATNNNMLYCFERYTNNLCFYLNGAYGIPRYLKEIEFDLIVFHDLLLCKRSLPKRLRDFMSKCKDLKNLKGTKIATVQDEYIQTELLNKFINEFNVTHVFSSAQSTEWSKIYPNIDRKKVKIDTALTGYLDEILIKKLDGLLKKNKPRVLDIGYRATPLRYQLGSLGYLKYKIGVVFKKHASKYNLKTDISNDPKDTFLGFEWYKFLLKSKYIIGVEGGASVLDKNGNVTKKVDEYLLRHPKASFDETKKACFAELDGLLNYATLSPRHLEACATKTCQVLIEGKYNNILKPWKHYIPIKKDFSNIEDVLKIIKEDKLRKDITERAYADIVKKGLYTYSNFVKEIIRKSLGYKPRWKTISKYDYIAYNRLLKREKYLWNLIRLKNLFSQPVLNYSPKLIIKLIERLYN